MAGFPRPPHASRGGAVEAAGRVLPRALRRTGTASGTRLPAARRDLRLGRRRSANPGDRAVAARRHVSRLRPRTRLSCRRYGRCAVSPDVCGCLPDRSRPGATGRAGPRRRRPRYAAGYLSTRAHGDAVGAQMLRAGIVPLVRCRRIMRSRRSAERDRRRARRRQRTAFRPDRDRIDRGRDVSCCNSRRVFRNTRWPGDGRRRRRRCSHCCGCTRCSSI